MLDRDSTLYKSGVWLCQDNQSCSVFGTVNMFSKVHFLAILALVVPALATETPASNIGGAGASVPVSAHDRQHNKRGVFDFGIGVDASPYAYSNPGIAAPISVSKVSYATAHYPKVVSGYPGAPPLAYAAPGVAFGGPVTYADAPYYSKLGYAASPLGYLDGGLAYSGYPGISYNGYAAIPAPGLGYGGYAY